MKNSSDHGSGFDSTGTAEGNGEHSVLDWPRHAGVVDRLLPLIESRVRRRRHRRIGVMAAGLAALLVIGLVRPGHPVLPPEKTEVAATSPLVLPMTRVLSDGSVVQLREGAEISVAFDEGRRRVVLKKGEAHFQVTKNPRRPFIVVAGGVEVRAIGTAFGVQVEGKAIEVLVTEGRVAVDQASVTTPAQAMPAALEPAPTTLAYLDAGNRVTIGIESELSAKPEVITVTTAEIDERMAWRVPRLDLSSTPLDEVIDLFNQYGRARFVLADPALGKLRISGLLRVDHPELLVRLLERDLGIRVEHGAGDEILCFKAR